MIPHPSLRCLLAVCGFQTLLAEDMIVPRTGELPPDSPYLTISLDALANDAQAVSVPSERVQVNNIPFNLAKKAGANHLFLKPIGWSVWKDESQEYPGYIANYDTRAANTNNPARAIVQAPVADYAAIWLLASADTDRALTNVVTFRLGVMDGQWRTTYHDFAAVVPRSDETAPTGVVKTVSTPTGNLHLVRVPLGKSIAQDFKERACLDLDITKELRVAINLPDPYRFQLRPLGPPSGVRIHGLTLERAPVRMEVRSAEPGHVFNEPQTPTFHLDLHCLFGNGRYSLQTVACGDHGRATTNSWPDLDFSSNPIVARTIGIPVRERGHYNLAIAVRNGDQTAARRETSFALLAPDTRKHRDESPFGTWDFGGVHFTPTNWDMLGPLYVKAGLRYGMAQWMVPEARRRQYGVLDGQDYRISTTNDVKAIFDRMAKDANQPMSLAAPARFLTFHEGGISGTHCTRTPDVFTGRPPYPLNEAEEKQFQAMKKEAEESFRAIRAAFPKAEIYFGNGVPHTVEEFLRAKFPRELLDKVGNESGSFMRLPETQPLDSVANNSGLWMFRQILDHYGYKDIGLRQCVEICYPGSNPGNLTEMTQAAYLVRHMMHSLAWGIPVIRPMCMTDMGNSYYYSNWGATGLCHAWPHVRPKPAYVAFATLTQSLDGAKYARAVPSKSSVVYAVEFQKKDKSYVTCLWTVRGARPLAIEIHGAKNETLINLMGRETAVEFNAGTAQIEVSREPVYLTSRQPVAAITPGTPKQEVRPSGKTFLVSSLGKLTDWTVETGNSIELETYNFMNPRRKGDFAYRNVAEFEGEKDALEVKPKLPCEGSQFLQMYSVLALNKPVEIPDEPTGIGLMVNGNGGWGRIIFEMEDASGQRWISIGAEQQGAPMKWMESWIGADAFKKLNPKTMNVSDWNSDDAWGRSCINHDGWRFMRFPQPGQYPGEGYHWPMNSQWRFSGDGVVRYPLKFKKLVVTLPEKTLRLTERAPPPRKEIYLKDLMATYEPAQIVFASE